MADQVKTTPYYRIVRERYYQRVVHFQKGRGIGFKETVKKDYAVTLTNKTSVKQTLGLSQNTTRSAGFEKEGIKASLGEEFKQSFELTIQDEVTVTSSFKETASVEITYESDVRMDVAGNLRGINIPCTA